MTITERGLPSSPETERMVLGAILVDEKSMHGVRDLLTDQDWSTEAHRSIWSAMCARYDAGAQVDRVTVAQHLHDAGELESVGGLGYLVSLDDGMPQLVSLESWAGILKDKALRRRMILAYHSLIQRACENYSTQDLIEAAQQTLIDLAPRDGRRVVAIGELVQSVGLDKLLAPRRHQGIRLPWRRVDDLLCGLHPSQQIVLAAATSGGKTSMALQLATHAARQGFPVYIVSREMSAESLFRRMVTQLSGVHYDRQRHGVLGEDERQRIQQQASWLAEQPIYIDEASKTVPAIHANVRSIQMQHRVGLVIVDYLQLLEPVGRFSSLREAVTQISHSLKSAAKEFRVPFVTLAQMTREPAKVGRRPILQDLKESGDVENDADVVLFIHPQSQTAGGPVIPCSLIVAKQREGPRNVDVGMDFMSEIQVFQATEDEAA